MTDAIYVYCSQIDIQMCTLHVHVGLYINYYIHSCSLAMTEAMYMYTVAK